MNTIVLIARQLESGMSLRQITSLFKVGRRRVSTIKDVMVKQGISAQQIERMSENDLDQIFPYHGEPSVRDDIRSIAGHAQQI